MELMEEERGNLDSEFKLSKVELNSKIEGLTNKNQKLERLNQALTKDLLSLKYDTSKQIRELQEKLEFSSAQVEQVKANYDQFTERATKRQEMREKEFDDKTREVSGVMRKQIKHKEENVNIIKEQYKQIQGIYATRVKDMEKSIELIGNKHVKLENRHKAVLNSFEAEIRVMRDKLAGYERYVNRIKKACYATKYDKDAVRKEVENRGDDTLNRPEFKVKW